MERIFIFSGIKKMSPIWYVAPISVLFFIGMYFYQDNDSSMDKTPFISVEHEEDTIVDTLDESLTDLITPEKYSPSYIDASGTLITSRRLVNLYGKEYSMTNILGIEWMDLNLVFAMKGAVLYKEENKWGTKKAFKEYGHFFKFKSCKRACKAVGLQCPTYAHWLEMLKLVAPIQDSEDGQYGYDEVLAFGRLTEVSENKPYPFFFILGHAYGQKDWDVEWRGLNSGDYWVDDETRGGGQYYFSFNDEGTVRPNFTTNSNTYRSCRCIKDTRPKSEQPKRIKWVNLPDLHGLSLGEAKEKLNKSGFRVGYIEFDTPNTRKKDDYDIYIHKQLPSYNYRSGANNKYDVYSTTVDLTVSKNKAQPLVHIPDAYSIDAISSYYAERGLIPEFEYGVYVKDSINIEIIKTEPAVGDMVPKGSKVKVFVEFYPVLDQVKMNVIGKTYSEAISILDHFDVEFIKTEGLKKFDDGVVVNQEPYIYRKRSFEYKGGDPQYTDYFSPGKKFKIYLAGKSIKTPRIIGKTINEAKLILSEYDISIGNIFYNNQRVTTSIPNDWIIKRQKPERIHLKNISIGGQIDIHVREPVDLSASTRTRLPKEKPKKVNNFQSKPTDIPDNNIYTLHDVTTFPLIEKCSDYAPRSEELKVCALNAEEVYIKNNTKYPKLKRKYRRSGCVRVSAIIEKDKSISNIKILDGIGGNFESEALRVIQNIHYIEPAKIDSKPVRVKRVFRVYFDKKNR